MNILIFEYATAVGFEDPSLLYEGRAILEGLLEDFQNIVDTLPESDPENCHEIYYLIAPGFLTEEYNLKWPSLKPMIMDKDLNDWLEQNISSFDACLFVAAEENMELYDFTCLIESKGVQILGSSSEAVMICSDKFKTYQHLSHKVPLINTYKLFLKDMSILKDISKLQESINSQNDGILNDGDLSDKYREISSIFDSGLKMVIKPADGVACQGITVVNSWNELFMAVKSIETALPYVLIQDFVEGDSCSVSLLSDGKIAYPLSLNRQKIEFTSHGLEYDGGEVPWGHPLSDKAFAVAKNAVETINGLKGFVGVDLILSDQVHLVEINSRLTTPFVALRRLVDFNMVQTILDACQGNLNGNELDSCDFKGKASFKKTDVELEIKIKN